MCVCVYALDYKLEPESSFKHMRVNDCNSADVNSNTPNTPKCPDALLPSEWFSPGILLFCFSFFSLSAWDRKVDTRLVIEELEMELPYVFGIIIL